jgi:tripartite-type tricarboxylate transporter receptor subunit TctC
MRRLIGILFVLFASAALGADEYPARAVRVIVPFAPGGGTDIVARILGQRLSQKLGQSFVIENRPAGSGIVGADLVAKAPADGYTLLFAFSSLLEQREALQPPPLRPDPGLRAGRARHDLAAARRGARLAAGEERRRVHRLRKGEPRKAELRLLRPGQLAAPRDGALPFDDRHAHDAHRLQRHRAAITALPRRRSPVLAGPIAVGMPHVRSGKLRALGVAGLTRSSAAPELPTIASRTARLRGDRLVGRPRTRRRRRAARSTCLNRELRAALDAPEVRRTLLDQGMDPAPGTPEQFGALIKADMDKWGEIGRRLGVKLD